LAERKLPKHLQILGSATIPQSNVTIFYPGFQRLRVNSLSSVKQALVLVEVELKDPNVFLDFFEFAFKFCLTVGARHTLPHN